VKWQAHDVRLISAPLYQTKNRNKSQRAEIGASGKKVMGVGFDFGKISLVTFFLGKKVTPL